MYCRISSKMYIWCNEQNVFTMLLGDYIIPEIWFCWNWTDSRLDLSVFCGYIFCGQISDRPVSIEGTTVWGFKYDTVENTSIVNVQDTCEPDEKWPHTFTKKHFQSWHYKNSSESKEEHLLDILLPKCIQTRHFRVKILSPKNAFSYARDPPFLSLSLIYNIYV